MAMANSSLLLHQQLLAERPLQCTLASGHSCQCMDAFLQSRKFWRKSNGAFIKAAPRDLHCKACARDGGRTLRNAAKTGLDQLEAQSVAGTLGTGSETTAVGTAPYLSPPPPPPPPSYVGSPLLWIGVGVGISALFSWAANNLKRYAMQQMFKTMMGQATPDGSRFGGMPMTPGPVFPVPPLTTPPRASSSSTETVDVSATQVTVQSGEAKGVVEAKLEPTKPDISPQGVLEQKANGERAQESSDKDVTKRVYFKDSDVSQDGSFMQPDGGATNRSPQSTEAGKAGSILSVEALEKMMEDPTVQKMVYPYLPEEMQNPATFKWMLQNPQYRQQLEEMLKSMGGDEAWDNRMMDSLKNFDLSSQEVKQQFEQIGLTPEEVVAKIMANPEVAMAFQSPKVQAAIMDCSQNPLSITKYQNDKEVMDVFNKISELFPGMTGSP